MNVWPPFDKLKKRYKFFFGLIVVLATIVFWKGVWGLATLFFDEILFSGKHFFWSNFLAIIFSLAVLFLAGVSVKKISV